MGNTLSGKKVIVVGAGFVGSAVAKDLDGLCDVILIEPQEATHHSIAAIRGSVVPGWENAIRIPINKLLSKGDVIRKCVKSVTTGTVILEDGTTLTADYVILCHGGRSFNFPLGPMEGKTDNVSAIEGLKNHQKAIADAERIVVVGGGPVGCEYVGEILAQYPKKKVTLIHSQDKLVSNSSPPLIPKAQIKLLDRLKSVGADVRLEARLQELPDTNGDCFVKGTKEYLLSDGSKVSADLLIVSVGGVTKHPSIVAPEFVNDKGLVKVDKFLQVEGLPGVFCCGDANNHAETKLAFTGGNQGKHVVSNIKKLAGGGIMTPYVGLEAKPNGAMFIPLGPKLGVGAVDSMVLGDRNVRLLKGKGLFTKARFTQHNAVIPASVVFA